MKSKKIMFSSFLFVIGILFSTLAFSGNEKVNIENLKQSEFKLYSEVNGVQIYYRLAERHDLHNGIHATYIELQVVNTTSEKLNMSWNYDMWVDGSCITCEVINKEEYSHKLELKASDTIEGDCQAREQNELLLFIKYIDKDMRTLTDFELSNLSIDPINE